MLLRLLFAMGLAVVLSKPTAAEEPFRVKTEVADLRQCQVEVCLTLQVTRSTFSNGNVETLLFFSHQAPGPSGDPILIPGFPSGFTLIPSEHFFMNRQGTRARLIFSGANVAWGATDELRFDSDLTEIERRKLPDGDFSIFRLTERGEQVSAEAEGTIGPLVINSAAVPASEGFATGALVQRVTTTRTRIK
jgi:hypothetical protein